MNENLKRCLENELDDCLFQTLIDIPQTLGYNNQEQEILTFIQNYIAENAKNFIPNDED